MQDLDVTAQLWGVTYYQIWAKERVTQNLRNFLIHIARIMNLLPSQISLAAS